MEKEIVSISEYHAHVYYDKGKRDGATRVREGLSRLGVWLGRWHDRPVGPHTQAMYLGVFPPERFGDIVPWLMLNREGLDILVHPDTGNSAEDHLVNCLWLGKKLNLKEDRLRSARY